MALILRTKEDVSFEEQRLENYLVPVEIVANFVKISTFNK